MSSQSTNPAVSDHPFADAVLTALRQVPDPELGVSIVDLGLTRRVEVEPGVVQIEMTMTSPACQGVAKAAARLREHSGPARGPIEITRMSHPQWASTRRRLAVIQQPPAQWERCCLRRWSRPRSP